MGSSSGAAEQSFAPDVSTVGTARQFVSDTLSAWGADNLSWTAMLLVTELSTNAVLHAATPYSVSLEQRSDGGLRIGVSDGSPRKPRARDYGIDATTGRGLGLVGSLAVAWGTSSLPNGKTVWCDLRPEPVDELSPEPDLDAFLSDDDLELLAPPGDSNGDTHVRSTWARAA